MEKIKHTTKKESEMKPLKGIASVKHFLNTKVSPKTLNGQKLYPVYMRVVFNRKSTNIKSNYHFFMKDRVLSEQDIYEFTKYNLIYSPNNGIISESNFEKNIYTNEMNEEARIVSEIVQFFGRYGKNILLDNPNMEILISLSFLGKIFSDKLWNLFRERIKDNELMNLLNPEVQFDVQLEILKKYANKPTLKIISSFDDEIEMMRMLKRNGPIRFYEWIYKDVKKYFEVKYESNPAFLALLKEAIWEHYDQILQGKTIPSLKKDIFKISVSWF